MSDWTLGGWRDGKTRPDRPAASEHPADVKPAPPRDCRLDEGHLRIFGVGLATAVGSLLITWVLAANDPFDNVASLTAAACLLTALAGLWVLPSVADRIAEGTAFLVVSYVAAKVVHLLFAPLAPEQFAVEAAVFAPWGPVIVTMGWVVFGKSSRLYATIGAYYAALLVPGAWRFAVYGPAWGSALAIGGSILLASGVVTVMVALLMDLETRHATAVARSAMLQEMAWVDLVTDLPNRRALEDALERGKARSVRTGTPLSLLLFDLDGFKEINDREGHRAGDRMLAVVGQRARQVLRAADLLGRWGGDEFLAILPDTSRREALGLAERLRSALASPPSVNPEPAVTASFGVATFRGGEPIAEPVARADTALYLAKARGRNRVVAES